MDIRDNPNYYFTSKPYKPKLICAVCRKVFKRRLAADVDLDKEEDWSNLICPNCGKKANYVGPKFRAPKLDNIKAWKAIEVLNEIGVLNFMGFATNRIEIPESRKGLTDLLTEMKAQYEYAVTRWITMEYNEENKVQIQRLSDRVKRIDQYLKKKL